MEMITKITYKCSICGQQYGNPNDAMKCEAIPVTQDKGVEVGQYVRIIYGEGSGQLGKVVKVHVVDKEWAHYAWERYWHTVALTVDCVESYGQRMLLFDHYDTIGR